MHIARNAASRLFPSFLAIALMANAGCKTPSDTVPMPPRETPPPRVVTPTSRDPNRVPADFEEVAALLKLDGEQLKRFADRAMEREKALDAWEKTPTGLKQRELESAIRIAQEAGEPELVASFKKQLQPLAQQFWDYRKKLRADVLGVLTLEQQRTVAAQALYAIVVERNLRQVSFDEGQLKQIRSLTRTKAERAIGATTFQQDPYLTATFDKAFLDDVVSMIRTGVMTDDQRRMSAPLPKSKTPPPVSPVAR